MAPHDGDSETEVICYRREAASPELFDEMRPLLESNYGEIAVNMGEALDPDWDAYSYLERLGVLRVFTARDSYSNRLMGYAVFFVRVHQHYKGSLQAIADVIYIDPAERGYAPGFFRWIDDMLRIEGVKVVHHSVTKYRDFSAMLTRMGYEFVSTNYARRL